MKKDESSGRPAAGTPLAQRSLAARAAAAADHRPGGPGVNKSQSINPPKIRAVQFFAALQPNVYCSSEALRQE